MISNMIASGVCKPLSMIISYIYVPIALDYLGVEKYGIWSTILTILSWISYLDIGIGNGLRNRLTESINKKDGQEKKLISSAYAFISVIMIVVIIIFSFAAGFIDWNRVLGVKDVDENLRLIFTTTMFFIAANFILSLCKNILYSLQKAADVSVMELMVQIINFIAVVVLKNFVSNNLFAMAIIYGLSMLSVNLVTSCILYKKERRMMPEFAAIDIGIGKELTSKGVQFFVIQICALILFTTDSIIISYLYGAANVTPYAIVNKMFHVVTGIYAALLSPIWGAVTKAKVEKNWLKVERMLYKMIILMIPFFIVIVLLASICEPISNWWLGKEIHYEYGLIIFGAVYCLLTIWCNTFSYFTNGMGQVRLPMIVAIVQAAVNLPLSLLFAIALNMHSTGILAGTVSSMVIPAVALPLYVRFILKKEKDRSGET